MKSKKKTLLSAICAIVLCMSLIAGSTFALFTSESKVNIAVTSGQVKVTATVEGLTTYSVVNDDTIANTAADYAGTIAEGKLGAGKYKYVAQPEPQEGDPYTFSESGTAVYNDGTLTLSKMIPGDKVDFNVGITNESTVNIKYRVLVTVTSGLKLFNALKVKIDGTSLTGVSRTGAWTSLAAGLDNISDIPVEIYMPVETGNEYNDKELSTAMTISVEAVQGNAKTVDGTLTSTIETEPVEVDVSGSKTTAAIPPISDSDNLVTVTIPKDTILTTETDTSLMVKVTPQDTLSNAVITVLNNNPTKASASYDVSVLKVVNTTEGDETTTTISDAIASNNDKPITVEMFVGAGLKGVELYHYDDVSGVTTQITVFDYDIDSGYITFETTSFSEYTVLYNKDYAVETDTGIVVYEATEIAGVYEDTKTGEVVTVSKGTAEDPFLVYDYATMQMISDLYDKGYYYFAVDISKTDNGTIDCTGWIPVKLHGSFDGNGVQFNNVTACLFQNVGYQLLDENITLKDFDATMNVSSNGTYGAAALIKNIFNSGITTFNNVDVHGYLEGYWNMGSFYNYGTANYNNVGSDYEVDFVNCSSDATIVCASGNVIGGLFGHAYEGSGNSFTLRVDNSEYTGHMFLTTSNGKGNKYFGMTSDYNNANNHFFFNGVEDTFSNGDIKNAGAYTNSTKIDNVTAVKGSNGYIISKQSNASKIVVTITAQLTAYDANNVKIPNLSGITMTLSSSEIENLDGDSVKVLDLFNEINIALNADAYNAVITDGMLNISIANSSNYKAGNIRLQVNQYDSTGAIISAGTIDIATCENANSEWIVK